MEDGGSEGKGAGVCVDFWVGGCGGGGVGGFSRGTLCVFVCCVPT